MDETINLGETKKTLYSQIKPNFVEVINWVTNQEDADKLRCLLDEFVSGVKAKYRKEHPVNKSQIYVSSNMPIEMAKPHHGCTGWTESRKRKR